ncbi:hypothetical protein CBR_g40892 [Chara braunii]|uniref:Uncharacterized protein n=1 Tax=Chara braunii TaxID=69332 RepID=A0A388K2A8_CHABU|nr:hypothetical protein CBR_g40892 [Chara braunii]|eukprot:GBG64192.1 hypothetical protein CBR_g40892 [Chara braunii]
MQDADRFMDLSNLTMQRYLGKDEDSAAADADAEIGCPRLWEQADETHVEEDNDEKQHDDEEQQRQPVQQVGHVRAVERAAAPPKCGITAETCEITSGKSRISTGKSGITTEKLKPPLGGGKLSLRSFCRRKAGRKCSKANQHHDGFVAVRGISRTLETKLF